MTGERGKNGKEIYKPDRVERRCQGIKNEICKREEINMSSAVACRRSRLSRILKVSLMDIVKVKIAWDEFNCGKFKPTFQRVLSFIEILSKYNSINIQGMEPPKLILRCPTFT